MMEAKTARKLKLRYRGRGAQISIYFTKLLKMFVYQSDWKVLPMAALIAALVGMVIRKKFFINMEGTLMGAFAMVCVCIWNGCFNSIQVICRERDVIKREHRSGMHISSYIASHMMYQALLCLGQVAVTLVVTQIIGVAYPQEGMITKWFAVDFCISMFLITYASDMMSLFVSTLAHNTTTAMTIMPFVLIFQLVFSGGMLTLPGWTKPLTHFTISNPGLKVIAAQADTNNKPYATISSMIGKMRDNEVGGTVKVGQILDILQDQDNAAISELRARELDLNTTVGEIWDFLETSDLKNEHILEEITVNDVIQLILTSDEMESVRNKTFPLSDKPVGTILQALAESEEAKKLMEKKLVGMTTIGDIMEAAGAKGIVDRYRDKHIGRTFTVGEIVDLIAGTDEAQAKRDTEITVKTTVGSLLDMVGEEKVLTFLEEKAARASYTADYEYTKENVVDYWMSLLQFVLAFALLATITLEFIDKDKR